MDKYISKKLDELLKNKKTLQKGHFFVTKDVADTIKKGMSKLTIRQAKEHHGRLRSGWGRPSMTVIPTARLGRTTEGGGVTKQGQVDKPGPAWRRTFREHGTPKTQAGRRMIHQVARRGGGRAVTGAARIATALSNPKHPGWKTPAGQAARRVAGVADAAISHEVKNPKTRRLASQAFRPKGKKQSVGEQVRSAGAAGRLSVEGAKAQTRVARTVASAVAREAKKPGVMRSVRRHARRASELTGVRLPISRATKRGSEKPKGNKIRKHPGHPDQSVHGKGRQPNVSRYNPQALRMLPIKEYTARIKEYADKTNLGLHEAEQQLMHSVLNPSRKVTKHLQGQHDQKDHTPKRQIAISREQAERTPTPTDQSTFEPTTQVPVAIPELDEVSSELGRGAVGAAGTAGGVVIGHALRPALGRFTRSIVTWTPIAAGAAGAARRAGRLAGAVRKPKKGRRKIVRRMRRSRASILRPVKKAGIRALKFLSRVRVPGAVGLGLLAAAGAYGLIRRSQEQKVRKAVGLTPGDHVLALFDPLVVIGIYIGKGKVRVLTKTSLADVKLAPQNIALVSQGTFVPTPDSDSEKLAGLVEDLNEEIKLVEQIIKRAKEKPIETMNKKIGKHLQGQHDQKDHTPKATLASPRQASTSATAPGVTRRIRPQRLSSLHNALNQVNAILDGVDAGTELYNKLKGTATSIAEQISQVQEPEKVMKALDAAQKAVDAALSKGISHSLTTLANATKLIREQKPNEDISGESDRKLGDVIDELGGMISYLKDVKKKGQFEKQIGQRRRRMPGMPKRPGERGVKVLPLGRPVPPRGHPGGGRYQDRPTTMPIRIPSIPRRPRQPQLRRRYKNE